MMFKLYETVRIKENGRLAIIIDIDEKNKIYILETPDNDLSGEKILDYFKEEFEKYEYL